MVTSLLIVGLLIRSCPVFLVMAAPVELLDFVDANKDRFIQRLARAVEIPRYLQGRLACPGPNVDLHKRIWRSCSP